MLLSELVAKSEVEVPEGDLNVEVRDITHDSRQVVPGAVFACVSGDAVDGHVFANDAVGSGAPAIIVDRELHTGVPEIVVGEVRKVLGPMASIVHGDPSLQIPVVGVTGTSGKTTVTHLLGAIFDAAQLPNVVMGTLSGTMTTPEGSDLQRQLAAAVESGTEVVAMEVSSHALALYRVDGTRFAVSVFTNLGRDHLDFHTNVESYFAAKARLFDRSLSEFGVVNRDDLWGRKLIEASDRQHCPMRTYGADDVKDVELTVTGTSLSWLGNSMMVHLPGRFNVLNAIAAATTADQMGIDADAIVAGIDSVRSVRGRFELVSAGVADIDVVVDYAHKPEALEAVLVAARELTTSRVVVVVGAGGDRDPSKRPIMGRAAATLADLAVITSDNPRSEDPGSIIDEMVEGIDSTTNVVIEPDRAEAIRLAIVTAHPGDLVLIAGKGHEATQAIGETVVAFDDVDHARRALAARRSSL